MYSNHFTAGLGVMLGKVKRSTFFKMGLYFSGIVQYLLSSHEPRTVLPEVFLGLPKYRECIITRLSSRDRPKKLQFTPTLLTSLLINVNSSRVCSIRQTLTELFSVLMLLRVTFWKSPWQEHTTRDYMSAPNIIGTELRLTGSRFKRPLPSLQTIAISMITCTITLNIHLGGKKYFPKVSFMPITGTNWYEPN